MRVKLPPLVPGDGSPRHGANGYGNLGCRCGICQTGHAAALAVRRNKPRTNPPPADLKHGTTHARRYWHCTCTICKPSRPPKPEPFVIPPNYMTLAEVTEHLGVSRARVYQMADEDKLIPFRKIEGRVYYLRDEVEGLPEITYNRAPHGAMRVIRSRISRLVTARGQLQRETRSNSMRQAQLDQYGKEISELRQQYNQLRQLRDRQREERKIAGVKRNAERRVRYRRASVAPPAKVEQSLRPWEDWERRLVYVPVLSDQDIAGMTRRPIEMIRALRNEEKGKVHA